MYEINDLMFNMIGPESCDIPPILTPNVAWSWLAH